MHAQLIPFSGGQGHALSLLVFAQYVQVPAKQQTKKSFFFGAGFVAGGQKHAQSLLMSVRHVQVPAKTS